MQNNYFETESREGVCIVWLDQRDSKVNKIGPAMISAFEPLIAEIEQNDQITAVVLISRKKDFIAGADIEAFANIKSVGQWQPIGSLGQAILTRIEMSRKPIVAAIHGACMGAGTEIALACTARIMADEGSVLALPEVKLGLLPGGGGTQRLPRLIGIQRALDMMLTGKNIYPYPAKKMGLVDRLATKPALLEAAIHFAKELVTKPLKRRDTRSVLSRLIESTGVTRGILFKKARQLIDQQTKGNFPAPYEIIECVKEGYERGVSAGFAAEIQRFEKLILTPESAQLRNIFFAMTEKKKNPQADLAKPIKKMAVLGAGFMGAGIAEVSIARNTQVVLKDLKEESLSNAKKSIWGALKAKLDRKALSAWEVDQQMSRITGQTDFAHFEKVDLVIEAVFEEIGLKRKVLAECEQHLSDAAIFASNTSALPIAQIASASKRPEQVIGMHYFSPVPKMPLLELVRTEQTADWVVATCYEVGLQQGKTVIVVKDGPGFYTTRILSPMMGEALNLLDEGADILQIDRLMNQFGFPVGPFTLMDEVGIDVGAHIMTGELMEHFQRTRQGMQVATGLLAMYKAGYHGRKNRKGFYRYDSQGNKVRSVVDGQVYSFYGGNSRKQFEDLEIRQRIAWSLISESARCLEEGILSGPLDGDVGAVFGLGFPPHLGGPFRYLDAQGLDQSVALLSQLAKRHGPRFAPPKILTEMAASGKTFY